MFNNKLTTRQSHVVITLFLPQSIKTLILFYMTIWTVHGERDRDREQAREREIEKARERERKKERHTHIERECYVVVGLGLSISLPVSSQDML